MDLLRQGVSPRLDDIGGEKILDSGEELHHSAALPEIIQAIAADWDRLADQGRGVTWILRALDAVDRPLVLSGALDVVLSSPVPLREIGPALGPVLLKRAAVRTSDRTADLAARALDGAVRLVLGGWWSRRYSLLDTLTLLRADERDLFATPVARLIGTCYEQWRDPGLQEALGNLLSARGSEGDVAFELAMAELLIALDEDSETRVLSGLQNARTWFARADAAEEERTDAQAFGAALDLLLAFQGGAPYSEVARQLQKLDRIVRLRHMWLFGEGKSWLHPRVQAEVEWLRLGQIVTRAAQLSAQPSWWEPRAALAQLLEAYTASRSVHLLSQTQGTTRGIDLIIEPRIEAAFIRQHGLRYLLEHWLEEAATGSNEHAHRLLHRATTGFSFSETENVHPLLDQLIEPAERERLQALGSSALENALERRLADREAARARSSSPVVDRLYRKITDLLAPCPDFRGSVGDDFRQLLLLTLRFLEHRYNINRSTGRGRFTYLFAPEDGEGLPLESQLRDDFDEYLSGSDLSGLVYTEVRNYTSGRVDLLVMFSDHRFVAEFKREQHDASRTALRGYLGQAGMYQGSNVTLGLLLVLDLTDKSTGPEHLSSLAWVEVVPPTTPDDLARYVVVMKVPGNRIPPSAVDTAMSQLE